MTTDQKIRLAHARRCRVSCLEDCAKAATAGDLAGAQLHARVAATFERDMLAIVEDAHCGGCGAATYEPCSPRCGFDGPTPSDAMADATEASRD